MLMNTKKAQMGKVIGFGAVILVVGIALIFFFNFTQTPAVQQTLGGAAPAVAGVGDGSSTFCANNPSNDLEARVEDSLRTGSNGLNATLVIQDLGGGAITSHLIDTANEGTTRKTFTNVVTCGASVQIGVITTQNTINSNRDSFKNYASSSGLATDASKQLHTQRDPVKYDSETTKFSALRCRAKDEIADARVSNGTLPVAATTVFINLDVGQGANFSSSVLNVTLDIDAADTLSYTLECKTQVADAQFGEFTGMWLDHQDEDGTSDDFENEPEVSFAGAVISSSTAATQDADVNSASEKFYNFGAAIGDKQVAILLNIDPKSSEDPDNSILGKFVGAGIVVQSGDDTQLIGKDSFVAYNRDQAKTQLATSTNNLFRISVTED